MSWTSLFLTVFALRAAVVHSFSACDDLDVAFVLNAQALVNPSNNLDLSDLVTRVLQDGSSEDDGFSVVMYGQVCHACSTALFLILTCAYTQMAPDQDPVLSTFEETFSEHDRKAEVQSAARMMQAAKADILEATQQGTLETFTLMDAFRFAVNETKPQRSHVKAHLLSGEGYTIDADDDATRYIIFDFENELIAGNVASDDFCALLEWEEQHVNETIYFLFGKEVADPETLSIDCGDNLDISNDFLSQKMLLVGNADLENENIFTKCMEVVFGWTCPSFVFADADDEFINLGVLLRMFVTVWKQLRCVA